MKNANRWVISICLLLMIACGKIAFAQTNMEDVVYLKNGSIIHGMIIEQIPNQTIKIQTADRNVFVFKMDEIEKITKEPSVITNSHSKTSGKIYSEKEKGYSNIMEFGFDIGVGDATATLTGQAYGYSLSQSESVSNKYTAILIHDINGIKLNKTIFLGLGLGFDHYFEKIGFMPESNYIPLFLDFRGSLPSTGNTSCFFGFDAGYNFGITKSDNQLYTLYLYPSTSIKEHYEFKGGLVVNPSVGFKTLLSDKSILYFSLGYKYFVNSIDYTITASYFDYNTNANFTSESSYKISLKSSYLGFKLGFGF